MKLLTLMLTLVTAAMVATPAMAHCGKPHHNKTHKSSTVTPQHTDVSDAQRLA